MGSSLAYDNGTFSRIEKFNTFVQDARTTNNYILPKIGGVNNSAGLIDIHKIIQKIVLHTY